MESDLATTALVLSNGGSKGAIIGVNISLVGIDLSMVGQRPAQDMRAEVAQALDIPISHGLLNTSHTHSGVATPEYMPDSHRQMDLKDCNRRSLVRGLVEAVVEADQRQQLARIGSGRGGYHVGVYRRGYRDGRDVLGEVLYHPSDLAVGVIHVDDLKGEPIAVLFSYGCHPVTVGPLSMVASTDFPGPARDVVESNLGGTAIFLQACGGNINPRIGIGYEVDCRESKSRAGWTLGGEVLKVVAEIRTHVEPGERTTLGDIPNILFTPWIPINGDSSIYLGAAEEVVPLQFIELPSLEEAIAIQEKWHQNLAEREAQGAQPWEMRVAHHFANWADKLVEAVQDGRPTLDLVLQAIRVNDIVLASMNVEAFFETGLAVKAKSPFEHTRVLGYSNGVVGYLPRAEDYPQGGWQVSDLYAVPDLYVQSYTLPVALHPDSEGLAVDRLTALIRQLQ